MTIEHFISNLSNAAIRREQLQGREYVVAPMAMLTEGVHNGSGGPLFYPAAECQKAASAWNMRPIVIYHPEINGRGVSACDPIILEKQQVGMVMNTRWDGKLRSEAWIEEPLANRIEPRVLEALEANKMMEVSTGLFTDNEASDGEYNGKAYTHIARNHRPDHLALLPDKIGACSIADGAGLLQLNEAAAPTGLNVDALLGRQLDMVRRLVGNALSHSSIHNALFTAIREKLGDEDVWVGDVYDGFFVYHTKDKMYRLAYTKNDTTVDLKGDPDEVVQVTEYRTTDGSIVGNTAPPTTLKENAMTKQQIVDGLIANAELSWEEADREVLMGLEEAVLNKMSAKKKKKADDEDDDEEGGKGKGKKPPFVKNDETPTPTPPTPVTPEPITMEQYLAGAPAAFRPVLQNGLAAYEAQKASLIESITANKANQFSKEFLAQKDIPELQGIAAIANAAQPEPTANNGAVPMFDGAATPGHARFTNNEAGDETPLVSPTMNWEPANN